MTKKPDFVVAANIKLHNAAYTLKDLDLRAGLGGGWEARAEYEADYSSNQFTITFNSEERFMELLALAAGEIINE